METKKVENTKNKMKKNLNKTSMVKAMGPFRDSQTPSWLSGPLTDVPSEPPSQRALCLCVYVCIVAYVDS